MIASFPEKQVFWFHCPMNQLKKRRGKNRTCGPYYTTRKLIAGANPGRSFYLDSDFAPGLRWQWCDDVAPEIDHTGWFTDEFGDGDKIRGIVFRLPRSRGFLAGWSMGIGMASEIDCNIYIYMMMRSMPHMSLIAWLKMPPNVSGNIRNRTRRTKHEKIQADNHRRPQMVR